MLLLGGNISIHSEVTPQIFNHKHTAQWHLMPKEPLWTSERPDTQRFGATCDYGIDTSPNKGCQFASVCQRGDLSLLIGSGWRPLRRQSWNCQECKGNEKVHVPATAEWLRWGTCIWIREAEKQQTQGNGCSNPNSWSVILNCQLLSSSCKFYVEAMSN